MALFPRLGSHALDRGEERRRQGHQLAVGHTPETWYPLATIARGTQWVLSFVASMPMTPTQLRKAIRELRLTQQGLADRLGVHVQTVKKWLAGDRRISEPVTILVGPWLKARRPQEPRPDVTGKFHLSR